MVSRRVSPNLALNQLVAERRAVGESIVHLGFGEARLPVFPPLMAELVTGAARNGYGPVAGGAAAREAAAGYFTRRRMPTEPDQVVVAPGSKPLLMALNMVVPGDVLLPRPCWNTYAPQAHLAGKTAISVPIPEDWGGVPEPAALRESIRAARVLGHDPRIMVLTMPDNPTGTVAPPELVRELCAIAEEEDLLIVSDEIYRDLVHDPDLPFLGPAEVAPRRTVVTTGLSKSLAIGGWRIGVIRFPEGPEGERIRDGVLSFASEVWSTLANPMQEVAAYALAEPPALLRHRAACARLHGIVAREVHRIVAGVGASCRPPTGGFYVYPDFEPLRETLGRHAVTDSASFERHLLDAFGVAVLGGHHLGDDGRALRIKMATAVLYGDTEEQQWEALHAADPLRVPHVAEVLGRIDESFTKLCG
ncbi:pyridoxal phosphate-dependent aminotransferase [Planomonospora parontospora]|uniref:pyridoxal phosphate-dependent aminotransferase n=1 Tax=Planomonospora parontospora TaxID=58119 RepID=UPI00166FD9BE|nr:pyridoxal phosphate-dependent aminotransferase [Planomonospora parontospora]GGL53674.1 aminopeptidase [Planomonospora parontospora subsp. antibiotica]GII19589.1 aminopeptidase [Planomonospora parontospora subsp. antibiotica]